jgi:hypothetical protein
MIRPAMNKFIHRKRWINLHDSITRVAITTTVLVIQSGEKKKFKDALVWIFRRAMIPTVHICIHISSSCVGAAFELTRGYKCKMRRKPLVD